MISLKEEKEKLLRAAYFPVLFLICIWTLHLLKALSLLDIDNFGVFPRTLQGLRGIFFTPLIHADFGHLFNNSVPLFILGSGLFYFYPGLAPRIILWLWITSGIGIWLIGREAYHIGASGLVYGLAAFLFFSGIFRNIIKLIAMALLVIFLYGSLIWGIFPIQWNISWEGHLFGGVTGIFLAFYYLKEGPQPERPAWMDEPDDEACDSDSNSPEDEYWKIDKNPD